MRLTIEQFKKLKTQPQEKIYIECKYNQKQMVKNLIQEKGFSQESIKLIIMNENLKKFDWKITNKTWKRKDMLFCFCHMC